MLPDLTATPLFKRFLQSLSLSIFARISFQKVDPQKCGRGPYKGFPLYDSMAYYKMLSMNLENTRTNLNHIPFLDVEASDAKTES